MKMKEHNKIEDSTDFTQIEGLPLTFQLLSKKPLNPKGSTDDDNLIWITDYNGYAVAHTHYKPISKIIDYTLFKEKRENE